MARVASVNLRGESLNMLVRLHPLAFHPQDWYRCEAFAGKSHLGPYTMGAGEAPAVAYALAFLRSTQEAAWRMASDSQWVIDPIPWADEFVLTSDVDHNGDPVYVGKAAEYGGFQVHRLLREKPV